MDDVIVMRCLYVVALFLRERWFQKKGLALHVCLERDDGLVFGWYCSIKYHTKYAIA